MRKVRFGGGSEMSRDSSNLRVGQAVTRFSEVREPIKNVNSRVRLGFPVNSLSTDCKKYYATFTIIVFVYESKLSRRPRSVAFAYYSPISERLQVSLFVAVCHSR